MRRRSYLKGLGLGIFVTALILSLTSNKAKGEMSDAEIRKMAAELGMVSEDKILLSQAQTLADNAQDNAKNAVSKDMAMDSVSGAKALPEGSVSEGSVSKNGEIIRPEVSQKEDSAAVAGSKPSNSQNDNSDITSSDISDNSSSDTSANTASDPADVVVITVNSGESSISVANKMVHAGLINDASQFDSYLVLSGYDRKLVVGSHPIPKGSTASEMGEILTTKQ